jgi:RpiR family carbohydrate utilization transcriptional regulator
MLERIKSTLSSLAPAEQRVGKLLLSDPRTFSTLPVTELAERAGVSKPTVVRFCRSMGYEGLSDFKLKLAGSLSEGVPFIHRNVGAQDNSNDVLVKVIDNTVTAFLKYRNDASSAAIDKAAEAIALTHKKGKRLEFFGVGNSGIVAQDAQHKFFRLGFHTISHSDGHMQIMSASLLGPGDCLVVFSNSGRTRDLLDSCEIAKKNGAADHPESYEKFSPMVSRLLHLMIVDVLATTVALRIGSTQLQPLLRNMKQNLLNKRYS